jgi:hypothetical protein
LVFAAVAAADGQTADGRLSQQNGAGQLGIVGRILDKFRSLGRFFRPHLCRRFLVGNLGNHFKTLKREIPGKNCRRSNYLDVVEGPHSNDAVRRSRKDDVHGVPLVQLRETDAEDVLRAADLAHQGVDAGQRVAIDGPEVEPSVGAGGDVASQVDGRQRRVVARRMADES